MRRIALLAASLPAALLAACSPSATTVTNEGNVVLNREQDNFAFTNDGETPGNQETVAAEEAAMNNADAFGSTNVVAPANGM